MSIWLFVVCLFVYLSVYTDATRDGNRHIFVLLQNAKAVVKVKAKVDNDEENSADGETSTGEDSGDDVVGGVDSKIDGDSNVGDDEDVWEELQREARKESILETKSKETHPVHCPYFPSVRHKFSLPSVFC